MGSPGSRAKSLCTCSGSLTTQGLTVPCDIGTAGMAFHPVDSVGALKLRYLSWLNSPARTPPVNASRATLRLPAHASGPVWVASPSPYGTSIHYSLPVFTGAPTVYLQLELSHRRKIQNKFIEFNRALLMDRPEIEELINTKNKEDIMAWLDSL